MAEPFPPQWTGRVKRDYAQGELVRVLGVRNQIEGEFIQGLLLEEGVPSMLRRSMGFDVPDFLASGPRDVMVPASGVDAARDVLLQAELLPPPAAGPSPTRTLATMLAVLALVAAVIWALDTIF
ncbi:hypothetical protein [Conexibacter arvalis]|uniref:DUF2007 domain-containing protein n=1 Tax=Conexibacter arvalis TaxID=912552 RepID=A0A840IEY5_9ACTN|nr:hypothetical protein [Conexibacter arvalis]MBB4662500.1 hypothetical protein [Conexibacter arvalis]